MINRSDLHVTVHNTVWSFNAINTVDPYKDDKYKLQLPNRDCANWKKLNFLSPSEHVQLFVEYTNASLRDRRKYTTVPEFYKFFGILYAMTVHVLPTKCHYWTTDVSDLYPTSAFETHFRMGLHRF